MTHLARHSEDLTFVRNGTGKLFCHFWRLRLRAGDCVMFPLATS